MAAPQYIGILALLRTPVLRIGSSNKIISTTVPTYVDINNASVRRDLHRFLGQWVVAASGLATPTPGTAPSAIAAVTARTGATIATPNANAPTNSYVQADSATIATLLNALKTDYNKTITDIGTIITELGTLRTALNLDRTALVSNGYLA